MAAHRAASAGLLAAVLCLACLATASASLGEPTDALPGVYDLTPENFGSIVDGKRGALVEFYAPWCGHCKAMTPEFKKLGELIQKDPVLKNRVVVAKVDADKHSKLSEKYEVKGFPTIKWFPRGVTPSPDTAEDYNGGRTSADFASFLKKKVESDKAFSRVEALDELVKGFLGAKDKAGLIKEVEGKVAGLSGTDKENGELYVALMKKAVEKGGDYVTTEKARLAKVMSGGSMTAAKAAEMSRKAAVLGALAGEAA